MKLHRLELTGFGPFRETQTVDFDAFDADGVFLITGRTGAGKSSILDGVSFALYGSVPRFEGGDRRLRSDHCFVDDPTEVRLEFTIADRRWRVTRAPDYERPAKRGGGVTTEPARVTVEEQVDGVWIGRAARAREAGHLLDEVLGLNAGQFQQVILLAQNKFARFLLADNRERQSLLRTLFGTRRFEQVKDDVDARRRAADRDAAAAVERVRALLDVIEETAARAALLTPTGDDAPPPLDERRARAALAAQRADHRAEAADLALTAADTAAERAADALATARRQASLLDDLDAARRALAALEARDEEIERTRTAVRRAKAAEAVRHALESADRTEAARLRAADEADEHERDWRAREPDTDPVELDERLTGVIALAESALDDERRLESDRVRLADLDAHLTDSEARRVALDTESAALPDALADIDAQLQGALAAAAPLPALLTALEEHSARADAAARAAALARDHTAARDAARTAERAAASAHEHVAALMRRRFAGSAGELAAQLVDGAPCPVCGSSSHPSPAPAHDDAVSADDITRAETAQQAASATRAEALNALEAVAAALADATAATGGLDADALTARRARLDDEITAARAAADDAARLQTRRGELVARRSALDTERDALSAQTAAAREERAGLMTRRSDVLTAVAAARGGHEHISEHIAEATTRRARARALTVARATLAEHARAAADSAARLDERLTASVFATAAEVRAELLDDGALEQLERTVAEHAEAVAAGKAKLFDLELAAVDLHAADVDVDAAMRARDAAEAARADAVTAAAAATHAAETLRGLHRQLDAASDDVADVVRAAESVARLADTLAGRAPNTKKMDLETFVLAAELEEIVASANLRLADMSGGRYSLHHSDARAARGAASGLGIDVLDAHTGQRRSPLSLSGGETFLASLALALGLAEVVTSRAGGIRLDTLFVDEGFGSLDPETLELAMRTLDQLRAGGRTVGIISHVEAMKDQIPAQLSVVAAPGGPSTIAPHGVTG